MISRCDCEFCRTKRANNWAWRMCVTPNTPSDASYRKAHDYLNQQLSSLAAKRKEPTPMTTPDDRIAADWTAEAPRGIGVGFFDSAIPRARELGLLDNADSKDGLIKSARTIDTSTTATATTPDTSTTAGKISVMAHAVDRGMPSIECIFRAEYARGCERNWGPLSADHQWDWKTFDYRIAPPQTPRSPLTLARERMRHTEAASAGPADVALCALVAQVDQSEVVEVCGPDQIKTIRVMLDKSVTPGRYRLVRDDA